MNNDIASVEDPEPVINENPDPDSVLGLDIRAFFARFAEGQDEILRLDSFMRKRGAELHDLTFRAQEKIELYLDEDVDVDALERLVVFVKEEHSEHTSPASEGDSDDDLHELDAILGAIPRGHASAYFDGIVRALGSQTSDQILRGSLLVSLVGELEIYVNQLLRSCFEKVPSAVDDNKAAFTWSEVSKFNSLADFRNSVTERAVEKALYGSLQDWLDFFKSKFGIAVDSEARSATVIEVFQRRHCIVHYGGSASPQYVQSMKDLGVKIDPDQSLNVTSEYLSQAADALYGVAMSLGWATAHKLVGDADVRDAVRDDFINRIYYLLGDRRYGLARNLSGRLPARHLSFDQDLIVSVNRWLAYKLDGALEEVIDEVKAFNTASLSRRFKMARHALLGEDGEAYMIAKSMLDDADEEFPLAHYLTWPLLRDVRVWARSNADVESPGGPPPLAADVVAYIDESTRKDEP